MIELIALKQIVVRVDDLSESERVEIRRAVTLVEKMSYRYELPSQVFAIFTIIAFITAVLMFTVYQKLPFYHETPVWWILHLSVAIAVCIGSIGAMICVIAAQLPQRRDGAELYHLGQQSKRVYCFLDECLEREPRFKQWMPGRVEANKFAG